MMGQKKFIIIALVAVFALSRAHIPGEEIFRNRNAQVFCGRNLARALALLCYDEPTEKRSPSKYGTMYDTALEMRHENPDLQADWLWPSHQKKSLELLRGKRFQGVVDECCDKACAITELMNYCL